MDLNKQILPARPAPGIPSTSTSTQNTIRSPLLRLPPELRLQIWTTLLDLQISSPSFSSLIDLNGQNPWLTGSRCWSPRPCTHNPSITSANTSLIINVGGYAYPGTSGRRQIRPERSQHLTYTCCSPPPGDKCSHSIYGICQFPRYIPAQPLICRQIWSEMTDVLFEKSVWVFHTQQDLLTCVRTRQACIPRIKRLVIFCPEAETLRSFCHAWQNALTWRVLRRFEALKGAWIDVVLRSDRLGWRRRTDLLGDGMWVKAGLGLMIRAFQQHRLEDGLTGVCTRCCCEEEVGMEMFEDVMRRLMLEYVPLGESGIVRERKRMEEERKKKVME